MDKPIGEVYPYKMTIWNLASLAPFDWILIAFLALSVISAFRRGIITVLFSIGGLLAGIVIAGWTYPRLASILLPFIESREWSAVLAFVFIVAGVMFAAFLAGLAIKKAVAAIGLGLVDRLLGAFFGLIRGALLIMVFLTVLAAFLPHSPWLRNSRLAPYFLAGTHAVSFVVPAALGRQISTISCWKHRRPALRTSELRAPASNEKPSRPVRGAENEDTRIEA